MFKSNENSNHNKQNSHSVETSTEINEIITESCKYISLFYVYDRKHLQCAIPKHINYTFAIVKLK